MIVVIWETYTDPVKFFVLNRDVTHWNGQYMNSTEIPDDVLDDMERTLFDGNGQMRVEMSSTFPVQAVREGAMVIVCGMLP